MKKKLESNFMNMVVVLVGVAFISSLALGFVYIITKERIDDTRLSKRLEAIKEVVIEGYDNNPAEDQFTINASDESELEVYPAKENGAITSVAIRTFSDKGYGRTIKLMVGFLPDGTINKITVLEQTETPGLGTKMSEADFKEQFYNKNPEDFNLAVEKDGGDVDAITAATISSRAFADAVKRAYQAYMKFQGQDI